MTQNSEWYAAMAARIKERDHALIMISRWTGKLQDAEKAILELSDSRTTMTETVTYQEPVQE